MLKVAVIGGGSTYTPELIMGFLARSQTFPLTELWLMDNDKSRLEIVGGFAQRMAKSHKGTFKVVLSTNQRESVQGASYVTTQLRVGHMAARREDEYLGLRHGLIGQETTGIGGLAKALRTIPVILQLARDMRELAPDAMLVNFANPAGLVTQALSLFAPEVNAVGVCNVAITTKMDIVSKLEQQLGKKVDPDHCQLNTLGLNHLTWHRGFTVEGEEVWEEVLQNYLDELRASDEPEYPVRLIETIRMIPNYYLQYYYLTQHKLDQQKNWPPSRAEEVMEVEQDLLRYYADPKQTQPPADLMKRGGAYYSTVATQLLNSHFNDLGETHIVNTRHSGAVKGWPAEWVLEMPCKVDREGVHPLPAEPLPDVYASLIGQVKASELLTAKAAVSGDRDQLYLALLAHPLGPSADQIEVVMDDLLVTNRKYLPQFWKS
jgi:6-phospho-beta-glucosidase